MLLLYICKGKVEKDMADITLEKSKYIYKSGQPMTALHLITKGQVRVTYPGGEYRIGKGDVIGICEVCSEIHFLNYITAENTSILTYPLASMESLDDLLQKHPDVARLFLLSAFRQTNTLLENWSLSEINCSSSYYTLAEDYEKYKTLCNRYHVSFRDLPGFDTLTAYLNEDLPDIWLNNYYLGLLHIYGTESYKAVIQEPAVSLGLLRKCSLDYRKTFMCMEEQHNYMQKLAGFYFHESGNDLFDFYTTLFYKLGKDSADIEELSESINRMISQFKDLTSCNAELLNSRIAGYQNHVVHLDNHKAVMDDPSTESDIVSQLAGSLNTILEFAAVDADLSTAFRQHVHSYKALPDKSSMDDLSCTLRRALTEEFYVLYSALFEKALDSPLLPMPVRMFLYFGYVDEELAGRENAVALFKIASNLGNYSDFGLYTFFDWLLAIYNGKKTPSRNEFDLDYSDYIHKQKLSGYISDAELRNLEQNAMSKVSYELRNMFPVVNKITFGRLTTFCPLFCADNVLKKLEDCLVTVTNLGKAMELVRKTDYSAFYRESLDTKNYEVLGKEMIHTEYLPDVILMPNVGIRGVMWQEIEGKHRNSPGRMVFSIFHMEDLTTTFIRLTGEFRWEMCKRIQGTRWNDISDRSLTSEYFDYIQFYRKNHELSNDAKDRVRVGMQRAKNSFKEMFVRDYIVWVLFEGNGSPRLNKVARRILFTYCPFPKSICRTLEQNPLYTEILEKHRIYTARRIHHLDMVIQKLRNNGTTVPDTLERERIFAEGNVQ